MVYQEESFDEYDLQWIKRLSISSSVILANEEFDTLMIFDSLGVEGFPIYNIVNLISGEPMSGASTLQPSSDYDTPHSFSRYSAIVLMDDGKTLNIYRDGVLLQSIDLSTIFTFGDYYHGAPTQFHIAFTTDGKYMAVSARSHTSDPLDVVLFKGMITGLSGLLDDEQEEVNLKRLEDSTEQLVPALIERSSLYGE